MNTARELDLVFGALGNETRRTLLEQLRTGSRTVNELASPHDMSLNAVSKHLKRLESAGLVRRTVDGTFHRIETDPAAMKSALEWMSFYAPFWTDNLLSLKTMLEGKS